MKIKFLIDFRGRETNEQFYQSGDIVDVSGDMGARLVTDGRAVEIVEKVAKLPVVVADEKPTVTPAQHKRRVKK
jgi:hypothetical protein